MPARGIARGIWAQNSDLLPVILPTTGLVLREEGDDGVTVVTGPPDTASDWASLPPATGPIYSQVPPDQPQYSIPTLSFNGINTSLLKSAGSLGTHLNHRMFAIARFNSAGGVHGIVDAQFGRLFWTLNLGRLSVTSGADVTITSGTIPIGVWLLAEAALDAGTGTGRLLINGVEQALATNDYTPLPLGGLASIGANFLGSNIFLNGDLRAVVLYSTLNETVAVQARRYLMTKFLP